MDAAPRFVPAAPWLLALALGGAAGLAQEPARTPAFPAKGPVTSPGNAEWAANAADARARALAQKKLVYYEFEAPGCGNCRRMQALLYPAFDFEALLIGMVPVKLDLDSEEGRQIAGRYSITETPSVLIATPEGRLVFLMQGFKDAPDFYRHARQDLDSYRVFAHRIDGQDVARLTAEEAYTTGRDLYARFDYSAAAVRLERASAAPDATPELRLSALEGLAAADLQLGQAAASRRAIDKVIAATKSPEQKERAELFRAQIALAENKPAEALSAYRKFAKDHPGSPHIARVRSFIARLEAAEPKS